MRALARQTAESQRQRRIKQCERLTALLDHMPKAA
jgi:hypothetical protein